MLQSEYSKHNVYCEYQVRNFSKPIISKVYEIYRTFTFLQHIKWQTIFFMPYKIPNNVTFDSVSGAKKLQNGKLQITQKLFI